jgi:hypothetical protein
MAGLVPAIAVSEVSPTLNLSAPAADHYKGRFAQEAGATAVENLPIRFRLNLDGYCR